MGTWWVWDARLTSMLVLFFLFLGHIALSRAFDSPERGDKAAAILALIGVINLPIISSRSTGGIRCTSRPRSWLSGTTIHPSILVPLLVMGWPS